jgi:nucleoid DNA-binding protein
MVLNVNIPEKIKKSIEKRLIDIGVKEKKERKGRNPATGEDMILEPRRVVTFRSSGRLREKLNGQQR